MNVQGTKKSSAIYLLCRVIVASLYNFETTMCGCLVVQRARLSRGFAIFPPALTGAKA
jgi:hypothetical protein